MKIDRLVLGEFDTNSYVVRKDESATDCLIVDTGLDADDLLGFLTRNRLNPVAAILTHGHIDHILGMQDLHGRFPGMKVYTHKLEAELLTNPQANLSEFAGIAFTAEPPDALLEDGDLVDEAGVRLEVLHTPGHTPGGICLYSREEGVVFVGDTLFADSVGRTDFPGGDMGQLVDSIRRKLLSLPDETAVYPGHGMRTTIGRERRANPFIR